MAQQTKPCRRWGWGLQTLRPTQQPSSKPPWTYPRRMLNCKKHSKTSTIPLQKTEVQARNTRKPWTEQNRHKSTSKRHRQRITKHPAKRPAIWMKLRENSLPAARMHRKQSRKSWRHCHRWKTSKTAMCWDRRWWGHSGKTSAKVPCRLSWTRKAKFRQHRTQWTSCQIHNLTTLEVSWKNWNAKSKQKLLYQLHKSTCQKLKKQLTTCQNIWMKS